ncbi:MAG: tape measure protein [Armatimonadota bacterium]
MIYRQLLVKYGADIHDAVAGAERLNSRLDANNKDIEKRFGALSGKLQSIGTGLSISVTAPLALAGKAAIDADIRFDSLNRGMRTVMGSSAATNSEISKLREVAKLPGLGFEEAIQGSLNLQAVGDSADQSRTILMAFGNALATVGKGKEELAAVQEQIMQMVSKGKVMTEDIRIIRSYVPQMFKAMRDAFGTSNVEEIAKMGISGQQFVDRIAAELMKLPKMTGGVRNSFENMSDATNRALASMGKTAEPAVIAVTDAITSAATAVENLSEGERKWLLVTAGAVGVLGPAILAIDGAAKGYTTLKSIKAFLAAEEVRRAAALTAETAATKVNTTAVITNTVAEEANAVARATVTTAAVSQYAVIPKVTGALKVATAATGAFIVANWQLLVVAAAIGVLAYAYSKTKDAMDGMSDNEERLNDALGEQVEKARAATKALQDYINIRKMLEGGKGPVSKESSHLSADEYALRELEKEQAHDKREYLGGSKSDIKNTANWIVDNIFRSGGYDDIRKAYAERQLDINKLRNKVMRENRVLQSAAKEIQKQFDVPRKQWNVAKAEAERSGDALGVKIAETEIAYNEAVEKAYIKASKNKNYNLASALQTAANKRNYGLTRAGWIKDEMANEKTRAISSAAMSKMAADYKVSGNEYGAAMANAEKSYNDAMAKALERDLKTGSYKVKDKNVRKAMMAAAESEFQADAKDALKTRYSKLLGEATDAVSMRYQSQGIAATAKHDELNTAIASANDAYAQEYKQAMEAQLAGNPNWKQMIQVAEQRRAEAFRKAKDDARAKVASETTAERSAALDLYASKKLMQADAITDLMDISNSPAEKLSLVRQAAATKESAAVNQAMAAYTSKMNDLNELKLKGIDITQQARLAEQELSKATTDAARDKKKAIEAEVESYRQRREAMIGFGSLTGIWQSAQIAGARETFANYAGRVRERADAGFGELGAIKSGNSELASLLKALLSETQKQTGKLDTVGSLA